MAPTQVGPFMGHKTQRHGRELADANLDVVPNPAQWSTSSGICVSNTWKTPKKASPDDIIGFSLLAYEGA